MSQVRTGLDRLLDDGIREKIAGRRVGLLAHPASVNACFRHAQELVAEIADLQVIFGPEHGFAGTAQDMVAVAEDGNAEPSKDAPRVVSLYGETASDLSPKKAHLEGLDVIVVDLQDVGSRYYTYVWSAAFVMRVAAKMGVETIVLDRPNPLGGEVLEGAPQRVGYRSFVGLYDVCVRHGMTIGEILSMVRVHERLDEASLHVVEMQGWKRSMFFEQTGLPWVLPSPNMPTVDTAIVYPGGCLIEGTTLSEARGTTRPFELLGAPGVDGRALAKIEAPGAVLRPCSFEPTVRKHAGEICGGVQVHVTDRDVFRSYALYLRLIEAMLVQVDAFPWRTEEYEYDTRRPAIDLLTGGPAFRQMVNRTREGKPSKLDDYLQKDASAAEGFAETRRPFLRYD